MRNLLARPTLPALLLPLLLALPLAVGAAAAPIPAQSKTPREIVIAPEPFRYCVVCHGVELSGNQLVDAPRLAGLPRWYLARQMESFRAGWRGTHAMDINGMEMHPQATVLSASEIDQVLDYAARIPSTPVATTVTGDPQRGAALFATCAVCHGAQGEGNEILAAPPLVGQSDWYLVTQLGNFRSGVRGSAADDIQGALMRASVTMLNDDTAVADVVAYINSLQQSP